MFAATAREADQARWILVPLIQWSVGALRHRPDSRSSVSWGETKCCENWQRCIQPLSPKKRMLHNDVWFNHLKDKKTNKKTTTRQTVPTGERSIPRLKFSFHPSTHWFSLPWNYYVRVEALLFCALCQRSHTVTVICWQMRRWRFTGHCTKRHVERGQTRWTWIQNTVTVQEKKKSKIAEHRHFYGTFSKKKNMAKKKSSFASPSWARIFVSIIANT